MTGRIEIRIRPDGTIDAVTSGIKGAACLAYVPVVEQLCGARVVDSRFTEEFSQHEAPLTAEDHVVRRQAELDA